MGVEVQNACCSLWRSSRFFHARNPIRIAEQSQCWGGSRLLCAWHAKHNQGTRQTGQASYGFCAGWRVMEAFTTHPPRPDCQRRHGAASLSVALQREASRAGLHRLPGVCETKTLVVAFGWRGEPSLSRSGCEPTTLQPPPSVLFCMISGALLRACLPTIVVP